MEREIEIQGEMEYDWGRQRVKRQRGMEGERGKRKGEETARRERGGEGEESGEGRQKEERD